VERTLIDFIDRASKEQLKMILKVVKEHKQDDKLIKILTDLTF
jgi:hypothetical protein